MQAIKKIFANFASSTTLHGSTRINHAKHWHARLFWTIIFLSASAMLGFQLSQLLTKYYKYEKHISIEIRQLNESELPCVTICFPHMFDSVVLRQIYDLFSHNKTERERIAQYINNKFVRFFNEFYDSVLVDNNFEDKDFFNEFFYDLNESIIKEGFIQFDRLSYDYNTFHIVKKRYFPIPCVTLQFKRNIEYGAKPYFFELMLIGGEILKQKIDARQKNLLTNIYKMFDYYVKEASFSVFIHPPNLEVTDLGNPYIRIVPKQHVSLIISCLKMERLGYPHGDCTSSYRLKHSPQGIYAQEVCNLWFDANKFIEVSHWHFVDELKQVNDISKCVSFNKLFKKTNLSEGDIETIRTQYLSMKKCASKMVPDLHDEMAILCPRACDEFNYEVEKIYVHFDDNYLNNYISLFIKQLNNTHHKKRRQFKDVKMLHNNISNIMLAEDMTILHFTLETDEITVIKENSAYTFVQLLSDVGGQLGLWLGTSVITVFEVLALLYKLIKVTLKMCKQHFSADLDLNDISVFFPHYQ